MSEEKNWNEYYQKIFDEALDTPELKELVKARDDANATMLGDEYAMRKQKYLTKHVLHIFNKIRHQEQHDFDCLFDEIIKRYNAFYEEAKHMDDKIMGRVILTRPIIRLCHITEWLKGMGFERR